MALQEEFEAVMLPRHSERRGLVSRHKSSAEVPYQRRVPKHRVPGTVDWRGSPANQYVKDQAACGSCWAFAATGVLEAAYYLATGAVVSRRLSTEEPTDSGVQHLVDLFRLRGFTYVKSKERGEGPLIQVLSITASGTCSCWLRRW